MNYILIIIVFIIILLIVPVRYGIYSFHKKFENDVKTNLKKTTSVTESILTETDIENLPGPVKKYIRNSGSVGKPKVSNFRLEFTGQIRKDETSEWMPFTKVQKSRWINSG